MKNDTKTLQMKNQTKSLVKTCFSVFSANLYVYADSKLYFFSGQEKKYANYLVLIEDALRITKAEKKENAERFIEIDNLFITIIRDISGQIAGVAIANRKIHVNKKTQIRIAYEKLAYESKSLAEINNQGLLNKYIDDVIAINDNSHQYSLFLYCINSELKKSKEIAVSRIKEQCFCNRIFSVAKYDNSIICACIVDEQINKSLDIFTDIQQLIMNNEIRVSLNVAVTDILFNNKKDTLLNMEKCKYEIFEVIRRNINENSFKKI